ncbi:MAG: hypothetical protein ACKVP0_02240 [Pirellulaceae bacterium]
MKQNPYESPTEVNSPPTVKGGIALGGLLLLSIPAGCICGGITCWTSGVVGEMTVEKNGGPIDAGYIVGIPIGLIVVVLIPVLAVLFFGKRKGTP